MITYGSTTLTSYNTITKIEVYYYKSTSATSLSGGSWSTTKPTWENGKYIWQKIKTTYEGKLENGQYYSESDPVNITGQQGQQGETGASAYSYKLNVSDTIISVSKNGTYSTNSVTFSATSKQGNEDVNSYEGRFKIETTMDGITWITQYTSNADESSKIFTIPSDISNIRCSLYQAGGTTVLLDITSVSIVRDGIDGALYPNLSPFFSHDLTDVYNAETNPNGYWIKYSSYGWTKNSNFTFTQLEDGWLHVHIDNSSGTSVIRNDCCMPRYNPSIKKGVMYTFLTEFRNNQSTGLDETSNFYLVQQSGGRSVQFWGINTTTAPSAKLEGIGGLSIRVIDIPSDGSYAIARGTKYSEPEDSSSHWTTEDAMATFTFRANAGAVIDYDIRLSMYEGEYWGNYVPYIISDVTDIRNSAEMANNKIDNLEIGGRNLLRSSESMENWNLGTNSSIVDGEVTVIGSSSNWEGKIETLKMNLDLLDGETKYLLSFDYKSTEDITPWVEIAGTSKNIDENGYTRTKYTYWINTTVLPSSNGEWKRFTLPSRTISISDLTTGSGDVNSWYLQFYNHNNTTIVIKRFKLERGNKATDWTPAPEDVEESIKAYTKSIQSQVDGMAEIHYGTVVPTLSNAPYTSWEDTATKDMHVDDLYYNTSTGYCYRFTKSGSTYSWTRIKDSDITAAATAASNANTAAGNAQTTANNANTLAGQKRRIFVTQPTPPYEVGDLWVEGSNGDIKKCKTARATGSYTASDWELASKYTDDTLASEANDKIDNLEIGGRNLLPFKDCVVSTDSIAQGITLTKEEDGWIRVSGTRNGTTQTSIPLWINPTGNNYNAPINDNVPQENNEDEFTFSLEIEGTPFIMGNSNTNSTHVVAYGNAGGISVRIGGINGLRNTKVFPTYMSVVRYYIGVNCEGSVDGRFRIKLEKGGKATSWTPAPEDVSADIQQVQDNLDNLEIGGRNLIIGTLNPIATGGTGIYRPHLPGQITNTGGRGTCTVAEHGLRFTNTTANWEYIYFGSSANSTEPCMLGLEAGQTYTLSADLSWNILSSDTGKANTNTYGMGALLAYSSETNPNNLVTAVSNYPLLITQADKGTDMSGRLVFTFTVPSDAIRLYLGIRANNTAATHYAIGDYLEARNLKLEKGSKATDWTPAPEDVETEITSLEENLKSQIDEKIQTFYQATNPADSWNEDARSAHNGDLWYYTGNTTTTYTKDNVYRYNALNNTWTVYSASGELFDKIDGKTTIYYGTTSGIYTDVKIGDYLVDSTDGSSYRYDGSNWVKATDYKTGIDAAQASADTANNKIDNLEIGGRNLLKIEPKRYIPTEYNAYELILSEPLEANQTYTIHLWNVDVSHSEKTEDQLGISVYYCGGSVNFGTWQGTNYFTNGHADHLILTFTPTEDNISRSNVVNATTKFIRLYNSHPNTSGTRNMSIEKWKLEKGNKATDWSPAPEDTQAEAEKAKKTATNYMSSDNTGIMVADLKDGEQLPANATGKNVFITAGYESGSTAVDAGVHIRDGQTDLASFGETARIGKKTRGNVYIDNDSVDINNDETTYASFGQTTTIGTDCKVSMTGNVFSMSNPKGYDMFRFTTSNTHDGNAYVSTRYTTDGTTTVFFSNYTISFIRDCYYEDDVDTKIPFPSIDSEDNTKVTFDSPPSKTFIIAYATMDNLYQATLGTRYSGDTPEHGAFGSRSIAIGNSNNGYGRESIAIGSRNNLNTNFCMGLGYYLNVGEYDRTEGVSAKSAQVVIGRYNEQKPNIDYSFIIGNGTSNTARHNAFAITTSNEIQISLDTTASSGTTDARLYDAITALGWQNDVIE